MLQLLLVIFVSYYNWILGLVSLCLVGVLTYNMLQAERRFRKELVRYVTDLNYRVKRVEGQVVGSLPFGLMLYSEDRTVEWHNRFVGGMYGRDSVVGQPLAELLPQLQLPQPGDGTRRKDTAEKRKRKRWWMIVITSLPLIRRSGSFTSTI